MTDRTSEPAELSIPAIGKPSIWENLLSQFCQAIVCGQITIDFPSGRRATFRGDQPGPEASLKIFHQRALRRLLFGGDMGLAEGFMAAEWETPDLSALLRFGIANFLAMDKLLRGSWARRMVNRLYHLLHANTRRGSRRNIAAHYDLGNDFYRLWLDQSMTYSAAIFEAMDEPLVAAQERKYQRLAEKIGLCDGDSVLEIGCGWGGFAEYAARHFDCTILCLTLSQEQADFATARIKDAGLEKQVEIRIQDYRDVGGEFDKIVSIEMFEAVGEANWPTYFDTVRQRLKADGKAGIQTITIADSAFAGYRKNTVFIQRYIFPGGMLANPTQFIAIADRLGLQNDDSFFFGDSYAETMRRWDHGFRAAWPKIAALGFDDRFYRMWRYYMCYCEAGFVHGHIDVGQFVLTRK